MRKLLNPTINIYNHLPKTKKGVVAVPTYYLTGKKALALDRLVERSLKERAEGKTRKIKSLRDLR